MPTVPKCPQCQQVIVPEDVNVANDVAYCRRCNAGQKLSALIGSAESGDEVDLRHPPAGVWHRSDPSGVVLGATHRSWGQALTLLGISLFWNGIVSVFVAFALSGTLHHVGAGVPEWFPAPQMNGQLMGVGELVFLWLFLTPFIVIGSGMVLGLLSTLGGKTEVRLERGMGSVYVGIGRLGWTRRFDPAQVKQVGFSQRHWRDSDGDSRSKTEIRLEEKGGKLIKFGSMLTEERQRYLAASLRQLLR